MALYMYQAFSREGKKKSGTIDAASVQAAREQLVRMALFPITISLPPSINAESFLKRFFSARVSKKDMIFFTKQLSVLLKSGVPLLQALELLIEQSEGGLRSIVIELKDGIKEGRSLADGLQRFPKVFDTTYIQLVRAGEASGRLEIILDRLTQYLERSAALSKKIKGALTLPLIQLVIILVVVMVLMVFVVPQIAQTFSAQGAQLPVSTQIVMGLSIFFVNYWYVAISLLLVVSIGFFSWRATVDGKRSIDAIKLKLPLVKYFARMGAVVQFSRTLGMLIEGGVNLAESLHIVCKVVNNQILVDALNTARENIIKQGKIAEYLKQTKIFPPVAIYLITTGEESGRLDYMLNTVADYYDAELTELADGLAAKLGPFMLVVMGVIVGFVVMAIGAPLMNVGELAGM